MAAGGEYVTLSLLSMPRMKVRGYLASLPVSVKKQVMDEAYREYVTEALRIISENTAKYAGGGYMKARYADIVRPKPEETRTGSEIIEKMREKLREVGGETS